MTTRRTIVGIAITASVGGFTGWHFWRRSRPTAPQPQWAEDFRSGNVQLKDNWILATSETVKSP